MIGTSLGTQFKSLFDMHTDKFQSQDNNVITPETSPDLDSKDQNEKPSVSKPAEAIKVSDQTPSVESKFPELPGALGRLSILGAIKGMAHPSLEEDKNILSGFYDTVKNVFSLAHDVYGGKIDPMSDQGIERAADLAGLMVMGPAPVAAKMADGTLGSFAGVKAQTLDKEAFYKAQKMDYIEGATPDEIWDKTGFFKGADGRWKFEIPDDKAQFKPNTLEMTDNSKANLANYEKTKDQFPKGWINNPTPYYKLSPENQKLGDLLDHPELFEAYPHLKDVNVQPTSGFDALAGYNGWYKNVENTIGLTPASPENMKSTLMHEIQHAIQYHEGFSQGGNEGMFKSARWKDVEARFDAYKTDIEKKITDNGGDKNRVIRNITDENKLPILQESLKDAPPNIKSYYQGQIDKINDSVAFAKKIGVYEDIDKIRKGLDLKKKYNNEAFKKYQSIKGEVESRNVQDRLDLGDEGRSLAAPYRTESLPRDKQIWSPLDPASLTDLEDLFRGGIPPKPPEK